MADQRQPSFHFGGPLGLAGMAMLASAAGLVVYGGIPDDTKPVGTTGKPVQIEGPVSGDAGEETPPVSTEADQTPDAGDGSQGGTDGPTPTDQGTDITIDPPVPVKPKPPLEVNPKPTGQPATAEQAELTFIVRIKNAPDIDQAVKLFRKDRKAAEAAFQNYVAKHSKLDGFELVGASYSGDLTLSYKLQPGTAPNRKAVQAVQDQILSVEGVAYADPDYIAHPGAKK